MDLHFFDVVFLVDDFYPLSVFVIVEIVKNDEYMGIVA